MFDFISGKLADRNPAFAVIDVNGIGYFLNISLHTYSRIVNLETATLYAHLVVKEDDLQLFGFSEREERELFRLLITVNGVGVNTARMMLSSMPPGDLVRCIASGDDQSLQRIKGIGSKTAQRIIIDLKNRISKEPVHFEKTGSTHNTVRDEALSGLVILGFPRAIAEKALNRIIDTGGTGLSVEQLIKQALKVL